MVVQDQLLLPELAARGVGGQTVDLGDAVVFVSLPLKVVILLRQLVANAKGTLAAQGRVQGFPLHAQPELEGLVGVVAESVVDVVVADRGACAERDPRPLVGGQGVGVVVELGHGQRAVKDQQVQRIAQVAQTAAGSGNQLAVLDHASVQIALGLRGPADGPPEGEGLARTDQQTVQPLACQSDVDGLVLLQGQIHAGGALDQMGLALRGCLGQGLVGPGHGKAVAAPQIGQTPKQDAFFLGDFKKQGVALTEQLALLGHLPSPPLE